MMIELLQLLLSLIFTGAACLLVYALHAPRAQRAKQVLLPPVALVCAPLAAWGAVRTLPLLKTLEDIDPLAQVWTFWTNSQGLLMNLGILAAFLVAKLIFVPLSQKILAKKTWCEALTRGLYQYDEDYDAWFLLPRWIGLRKFARAVLVGAVLGAGGFLGVLWAWGLNWEPGFPALGLMVLLELYAYFNGQTREEFEHSILGDEADARRVSRFYKVREVLEALLPEPLLAAHTGFEFSGKQTPADLIKTLKASGDRLDAITAEYFEINRRYTQADTDCVQATVQMMHRKNLVFFNPFYRDAGPYVLLPMVNCLLSGKKCLVVTGRRSHQQDAEAWLSELLRKYSHMKSLWKVQSLSEKEPDCEVGVLSFPQLYQERVMEVNGDFFRETDFVLLLEPSLLAATGQVGLSILAQTLDGDETPVYCVCDRRVEGLVDTLSHLLRTEFTQVVAPPVPRCVYTVMGWDADGDFLGQMLFDRQTRCLGGGVELAAIAVKNQIPRVSWYCETKAPIRDIRWLAGESYATLCRYMNLPAQQEALYDKIAFLPNLWSAPRSAEQFLVAEDEFCNLFSAMQAYLARGTRESFVNVLSENYLLRDYMRCNKQMFLSNPNAVPSLAPAYAKTERNTLFKLLLLMTSRPVTDAEVTEELALVGIEAPDPLAVLSRLLEKYTYSDGSLITVQSVRREVDALTATSTSQYTIPREVFDEHFAHSLKTAYFLLEEEKREEAYLDAKLFSHVTQLLLPGQFVVYDGKYYQAKHVSPENGVVLRRAADLFEGRRYYRQLRCYRLSGVEVPVSVKKVMDLEIAYVQTDLQVDTQGYLDMEDLHDLRTARLVDLAGDPSLEDYRRQYHNKTVLRLILPETEEKLRFTLCLLLSEALRSIFPEGWPYLAVVTRRPEEIDGMLRHMVYTAQGMEKEDAIYIIEDSPMDLGLLEAVDRNLEKLLEILADFLDWHFEKLREPPAKDPVPVSVGETEKKAAAKKRGLFHRVALWVRRIFGSKEPEEPEAAPKAPEGAETPEGTAAPESPKSPEETAGASEPPEAPEAVETPETTESPEAPETPEAPEASESPETPESPAAPREEDFLSEGEDPELAPVDGTDIFEPGTPPGEDFDLEREFERVGIVSPEKTRYQRECFLKFGFDEIDGRLRLEDALSYLRVRGWSDNALTKARKRDVLAKTTLDLDAVNHCDFCGLPISGVSYEVLNDGRVRCNDCSSSAISTMEDLRGLFHQALEMLEVFYGVKYKVPIQVRMTDARTVARGAGMVFRPTTEETPRVLGYAQRRWGKYTLVMENGSPRLAATDTLVHELTHIWQYLNWKDGDIAQAYKMGRRGCSAKARDIVYEGMAMWAAVQYLYQIGESYFAARQEALAEARTDLYGIGFRLYAEQYPLVKDSTLIRYSPFTVFPPLDPAKVREQVKATCSEGKCVC